jgi:hypothetical protein
LRGGDQGGIGLAHSQGYHVNPFRGARLSRA